MPLVVKTLSFNSLVWYPKAAHLSSNITYPLYTSVAQHYCDKHVYQDVPHIFF